MKVIRAADLFCGAGGTTLGLSNACKDLGFKLDLVAVNHWQRAVETHSKNHPWATHFCSSLMDVDLSTVGGFNLSLDSLDPRKAVPAGKLDVLIASPECTHHSNARGGKPRQDQSRATAWCVVRWADALRPHDILVENVPEFRSWGPLGARGQILKRRRGETYVAFLNALRSLGYAVEDRLLCSADYGDPTTRKRLFILARRGRRKIRWPEPSHAKPDAEGKIPEGLRPWRPAREIIDWSLPGKSIFGRKKPLAKKTIERIATGIRKFWGEFAEPFLVMLYGTNDARSVDLPAPTVTAQGGHVGLATPFLVRYHGGAGGDKRVHDLELPLPVQDCSNRYGLCSPFVVPHRQFKNMNVDDIDEPLRTVLGHGGGALVEPFILPQFGEGRPRGIEEPLNTVTTTSRGIGLLSPFLVKYYGNGSEVGVDVPLDTVTGKPHFGLVEGTYALDILFRMLQPHELAAAMGFPVGYFFAGTKDEQVRQIGGAVTGNLAEHLGRAMLIA